MKLRLAAVPFLLTLFISACAAGGTPQATPMPATATEAVVIPTDTSIPPTETTAPATETATEVPVAATEQPASSADVSFANDVLPILQARCFNCHGVQQVKEGLDLRTYDGIINGSFNGPVINPGNADDSYLVQQIIEGEMPKRGPHLTSDQIQIIVDWVNQGALNN